MGLLSNYYPLKHYDRFYKSTRYHNMNNMNTIYNKYNMNDKYYINDKEYPNVNNYNLTDGIVSKFKGLFRSNTEIARANQTAIDAAKIGDLNELKKAIKDGADQLYLALIEAAREGQLSIVQYLVKNNIKNARELVSPLKVAQENGKTTIVNYLINYIKSKVTPAEEQALLGSMTH